MKKNLNFLLAALISGFSSSCNSAAGSFTQLANTPPSGFYNGSLASNSVAPIGGGIDNSANITLSSSLYLAPLGYNLIISGQLVNAKNNCLNNGQVQGSAGTATAMLYNCAYNNNTFSATFNDQYGDQANLNLNLKSGNYLINQQAPLSSIPPNGTYSGSLISYMNPQTSSKITLTVYSAAVSGEISSSVANIGLTGTFALNALTQVLAQSGNYNGVQVSGNFMVLGMQESSTQISGNYVANGDFGYMLLLSVQ